MTDDQPTDRPYRTLRVADVQLRGRAGPLRARAYWPAPASSPTPSGAPPLLVLFPRPTGTGGRAEALGRGLCSRAGAVVLAVGYRPPSPGSLAAALEDATTATHWAADHAAELGAAPGRLAVAGEGVGADLAATVARHARDEGWPPIVRQVLVRARLGAATLAATSLAGVAPATVLAGSDGSDGSDGSVSPDGPGGLDDGRRYASLLRGAGVPVDELDVPDDPLAALASSLRRALAPSPAAPGPSPDPDRDDAA
jgi:acetyl esterase/lipase